MKQNTVKRGKARRVLCPIPRVIMNQIIKINNKKKTVNNLKLETVCNMPTRKVVISRFQLDKEYSRKKSVAKYDQLATVTSSWTY